MPEHFTLADLASHPIMGTWSVEGHAHEFPGFLYLDGDNLHLTLYLSNLERAPFDALQKTDPNLKLFAPPNQPTLLGRTKAAGHVTLFHCVQSNYQAANQLDPPLARVELTLRPTQAWIGKAFVDAKQQYTSLSFVAPGLHNVLSTIHVDHVYLGSEAAEEQALELKKLTDAHQVYFVHRGAEPSADITMDGKPYKVRLFSSVSESHSSTAGMTIQTTDEIVIDTEGATLAELINVSFELEQFVALLCIGPFRRDRLTVRLEGYRCAELLWRLGSSAGAKEFAIMPHELLVALGRSPDLTKRAIEHWFTGSEATRMARWLIFDSLFDDVSSSSKFLSVTQAWEVAGREKSKAAPFEKNSFKKMCGEVEEIIHGYLGASPTLRLMQLLRSSNRESFGTLVENTLSSMPPSALDKICGDIPTFVSNVVRARNTLTHLQGSKKLSIESASYLSLYLTYKLIVLFCIDTCMAVGLPLDNLDGMLANNKMARIACRALPAHLQ
jgi:hypothetical protein